MTSLNKYFLVLTGGGIGSVARYWLQGITYKFFPENFPTGTLFVNIIGCFLIGLILTLGEDRFLIPPEIRLLLTVGFCGGFTTFSTFSYETLALARDGEILFAGLNVGLSVVVGFIATYAGILFAKLF